MLGLQARLFLRMAVAAAVIVVLAPVAAHAASPTWLEERRVEQGETTIYGVSCPSVTMCVAAAGAGPVVQDSDFPAVPATDPDPAASLEAVSCAPGTDFCMFVDDTGGAFTYSGGTFGSRQSIDGTTELHDVSCPTSGFCMAIDHNHKVFKYSSGSWDGGTTLAVPGTFHPFVAISCVSSSFCVALANKDDGAGNYGTVAFTFNGASWSSASSAFDVSSATQAYATSVSCTSTTFCLAAHEEGNISVFNGLGWTTSSSPVDTYNSHPLPRVSCIGTTCMLVDYYDNWTRTTDGGSNWSTLVNFKSSGLASGIGGIESLDCANATLCVAGDGLGQVTTFAEPPAAATPSIAGSALVGQTLSLTHGDPATPGAWFLDEWWRCGAPGSSCGSSPISSSPTAYTLVADDTDSYVEAREVFGFGFYWSAGATSNVIGPVCNGTCTSAGGTDTPGTSPTGPGTTGSSGGTETGVVPPKLSAVSAPTTRTGAPVKLKFTLAGPAKSLTVRFDLKTTGRKAGRKCVAPNARNRKKKSCTRFVRVGTVRFLSLPAGANVVTVSKVAGRKLKPGTYRLRVQSFDGDGNGLAPVLVKLKITR